ncbi:MAG: DNA internalization-related competence protein ComEC/Rec2 [Clostridia bacterium]|nr:DNA internalization-related competence protein ComEC/Rec2 [Clostridia bacterium]
MNRPLLLFSIALIMGILTAFYSGSILIIVFFTVIISLILIFLKRQLGLKGYLVAGIITFFLLGTIEYLFVSSSIENRFSGFIGENVSLRGYLVSEPDIKEQKITYVMKTYEIAAEEDIKEVKGKVLVTVLRGENSKIYRYGQELEISGVLRLPKGSRNPGGFDYSRYLAGAGISATIFSREYNIRLLGSVKRNILIKSGLFLRERIVSVVNSSLPKQQAGLLNGMLIGHRDGLEDNVQEAFSNAGLSHIMAVSGSNIVFIIFPLAFFFKRIGVRKNQSNTIIILILILFVYITGFSPSVVRAVIMAVIVLTAQIIKREPDVFTSIALAAVILLLYNPYVLFDVGFQLSFGATLSLVLFYKIIKEKLSFSFIPKLLTDLLAVTFAAQIGVLPITAYHFNKISVISVFSNIFVVPLTGVITVLGFILAIVGQISLLFSKLIGLFCNTLLTFILYVTKISSELPFAALKLATPGIVLILTYYTAAFYFLWYRPIHRPEKRIKPVYCVMIFMLIIGSFFIYKILPGRLEAVFVDVGQGDCTFIKSHTGKTILIDGGGSGANTGSGSDIGENTVIPFLFDYGVTSIDTVIATHGHEDHIGGLLYVLGEMNVRKLIIPDIFDKKEFKKLIDMAGRRGIPVYKCSKGDMIRLDSKTYLEVIHPVRNFKIDKSYSNNSSLVLKLKYKAISILFAGDIEMEAEDILLEDKSDLKADVLKVAHHGSLYSTSEAFIDSVRPEAAVICVGNNNFGHPGMGTLDRIRNNNIEIFRTDECGAVMFASDGEKISVRKTIGEMK